MRRASVHRRWSGGGRVAWAGLLAALVLFSGLDLHLDGKGHGLLPPGGDDVHVFEALHPDQPLHMEPAHPTKRPLCPACLHNLQTRGSHLRAIATLAPPTVCLAPAGEARWLPAGSSRCSSGARAPPSLS